MKLRCKRVLATLDRIAEILSEKQTLETSASIPPALAGARDRRLAELDTDLGALRSQVELDMAPFRDDFLFDLFKSHVISSERKKV